jgi:hypothetical protein
VVHVQVLTLPVKQRVDKPTRQDLPGEGGISSPLSFEWR